MADKAQMIKYKSGKITFEIATKKGAALKYRQGTLGYDNVLHSDTVWKNFGKGERASDEELGVAFGNISANDIIKLILEKGELSLSTDERKEMVDQKRREIVNYIHKYYVDPKTRTPHPVTRIDAGLTQIKARIEPDIPADRQAQELIKKLIEVVPLKRSEIQATITVSHQWIGATAGILKKYCVVSSDKYTASGCEYQVTLVPGDYEKLNNELKSATKDNYGFDIIGGMERTPPEPTGSAKKGGGGKKGGRGKRDK
eukprot:TRINITY_DN551_c0_g1_i2.p1 TRINITY_DN551_c0_g1~~TRINITY_DN551_c0_g1_i2.p1  ORF type:complete len:269 (-),score=52.70 TRINITY_DN551_c0_g1_i2:103-873(-)